MNYDKLVELVKNSFKSTYTFAIAVVIIICTAMMATAVGDYLKRSHDLEKGVTTSKLLWNNIGQCFYVELDDFNKYYKIVRVEDCDKTK